MLALDRLIAFATCAALVLVSCGGAPLAEPIDALPEARPLAGDPLVAKLDASNTSLEVDVHALSAHTLAFEKISGEVALTPGDPIASRVDVSIETASATSSPGFVADVAKSDFLHVARYPTARFASRAFERTKTGLSIAGEISLHGVTRAVRVPAKIEDDACSISVASDFVLNRKDYGVVAEGSIDRFVGDQVEVRIAARVPKKQRPASCEAQR